MGKRKLAGGRSAGWAFMDRFDAPDYDDPAKTYLTRWRILSTPWFGIYLHRITGPDPKPTLHDHPWNFISLVLRGGYVERYRPRDMIHPWGAGLAWFPETTQRIRWVNAKRAEDVHSIRRLTRTPTWTLLLVGPRRRTWGYLDDDGTWVAFDKHRHNEEFQAAMAERRRLNEVKP